MDQEIINQRKFSQAIGTRGRHMAGINNLLMHIMKLHKLNREFKKVQHMQGTAFMDGVLRLLKVDVDVDETMLHNIPKEGAFIVLANHPYGGIDGLILLRLISAIRPDVKLMANFLLKNISQLDDCLIAVDPFETKGSSKNILGIKQVVNSLQCGHPVIIFPAGEVSAFHLSKKRITDGPWHPVVGKLIAKVKVPILPVYFQGNNSLLFNLMGMVHPMLRTARLPAELFNKSGHRVPIHIGHLQPYEDIPFHGNPEKMLIYLRAYTYSLAMGLGYDKKKLIPIPYFRKEQQAIAPPVPQMALEENISKISEFQLLKSGKYELYLAPAQVLPQIMQEIGRLREITYRDVGEGTNKATDTDLFDVYYLHLFLWDKEARCIVGAYRMGKGKELFHILGKRGFYISQLFKLGKGFMPILQHGLELGRSWVRKEYQRQALPLYLLWKGILQHLKQHPEYEFLIGPVSISKQYSEFSRCLIVDYIRLHHFDEELAKSVKAKKKFKPKLTEIGGHALLDKTASIRFLDKLIALNESGGLRFPVLLKRYLELNATIVGFNIDPKFEDCLDGLMVLQLKNLPLHAFNR
ncbi:lysophospholipid acyltransferase family protein [Olivibacter sitiensis]|uniref:lysophospholipid acyltransferase family protein n=1 Tax=Olivibacter sitiensis TaxID=376470 RepID=UPI0004047AB3|nr:lysophospholipid acyltransferase family protein [Olivibacter sitiensis]